MHCQEMPHHYFSLVFLKQILTQPTSPNTGLTSISWHNMDLQKHAVQGYFTASLASHRTYQSTEFHYLELCKSFSLVPLPTSEGILCYFATCLGQDHSTIRTYISRVRQLQISQGGNNSGVDKMPHLQRVLQRVKVECRKKGKPTHSCLPITPEKWECHGLMDR